ncbi:glutamate 5-kinase [Amedibacillus sp. YH-ame6]
MKQMKDINRIVVKVGSSTLTHANGGLNFQKIDQLAMVLSDIKNSGKDIILVSSGAVSAGVSKLQMKSRPTLMREKQAAASVGQCELMFIYDKFFSQYGQKIAQLLITKTVTNDETLRTNAINTLETLLEYGVIPIVNENDSVAVDEIAYGDNDTLSAVTASIIHADLLILLSDIDGLFDDDPSKNSNANLIPVVSTIDESIESMAKGAGSKHGTGGMVTKIHAARFANERGIPMIIGNGERPAILYDILNNDYRGTLFDIEEESSCN